MANINLDTLVAWLLSEGADENVAPRQIILQVVSDDDDDDSERSLVAIANVGEEDYLAGEPDPADNGDLVAILESLNKKLVKESASLLGHAPDEVDVDDDDDVDDEDDDG